MIIFTSRSAAETKRIGGKIGGLLKKKDVVALEGELGAGKTTLVKGIAKGLGILNDREVLSPSFALIHEYAAREKIYHLDWYRLGSVKGTDESSAEECFQSGAVVLIEWANRGRSVLPAEHIRIQLEHTGPKSRKVKISATGKKYRDFLNEIVKL